MKHEHRGLVWGGSKKKDHHSSDIGLLNGDPRTRFKLRERESIVSKGPRTKSKGTFWSVDRTKRKKKGSSRDMGDYIYSWQGMGERN